MGLSIIKKYKCYLLNVQLRIPKMKQNTNIKKKYVLQILQIHDHQYISILA